MSSVFLSHNWADKEFARRLAGDLRKAGARVWLDEAEIRLGDSLIEKIRQGIDEVEYLAVILSPSSVESEWVKKEVDIAMNQEIEGKRVRVLPIMHKPCELPGFLKGKRYADMTSVEKYQDGLALILDRLELAPRQGDSPAPSQTGTQFTIHIDRSFSVVGGPSALLLTLEEYIYDTNPSKRLVVVFEELQALRDQLKQLSNDGLVEVRSKILAIRKRLADARFFDHDIELFMAEALEPITKWFRPPSFCVMSSADLLELAQSTLNIFLKHDPVFGVSFAVFPENNSWSKTFRIPDDDLEALLKQEGVDNPQMLDFRWGLQVIDLPPHLVRQRVIPAIVWQFLYLKYVAKRHHLANDDMFRDVGNLSVGMS